MDRLGVARGFWVAAAVRSACVTACGLQHSCMQAGHSQGGCNSSVSVCNGLCEIVQVHCLAAQLEAGHGMHAQGGCSSIVCTDTACAGSPGDHKSSVSYQTWGAPGA